VSDYRKPPGYLPISPGYSVQQKIAHELEAPDVRVQLRALDRWVQQGPKAPLDLLIVAPDDEDKDVRTKAIIKRHWAVAQETEQ
jgi:hypothetical protein